MKDNFKKSPIIMLPTDQKSEVGDFIISKVDQNGHLACGIKKGEPYNCSETRQHLYVLGNEYVQVGDVCLVNWGENIKGEPLYETDKVSKIGAAGIMYFNGMSMCFGEQEYHKIQKIVASSDETLGVLEIPQPFIKNYVNLYNQDKAPDNVLVEYNAPCYQCDTWEKVIDCPYAGPNDNCHAPNPEDDFYGLNPKKYNGKAHIELFKENYSRQEVIDLIRRYDAYLTKLDSAYLKSAVVDKWIENNIL